jgi:hypothetical protein
MGRQHRLHRLQPFVQPLRIPTEGLSPLKLGSCALDVAPAVFNRVARRCHAVASFVEQR